MYHHARGLASRGFQVKILTGAGSVFDERVSIHCNPLWGSKHPTVLEVKAALDGGAVPADFERLTDAILDDLAAQLGECDLCIAHNILTLHKNLPLTAALARYQQTHPLPLIAWCHDLAWTNAQYQSELHAGVPWELLRTAWRGVRYVTVSQDRQAELAALLGLPLAEVRVITGGVDPAQLMHWTPAMHMLESRLHLMDADGLLLLPARLTRRKNIAVGLHVLAALRQRSGGDFRLIVTGPPGPHNVGNLGYLGELLELRRQLDLEASAHFLYDLGDPFIPDDGTMANLYHAADALFFPSLQEGFGIPILEAGLAGIPIFCSEIAPFRETGQADVTYFDPLHDAPAAIADLIVQKLQASPLYHLRVRVRQQYRWERIIEQQLIPLIEERTAE